MHGTSRKIRNPKSQIPNRNALFSFEENRAFVCRACLECLTRTSTGLISFEAGSRLVDLGFGMWDFGLSCLRRQIPNPRSEIPNRVTVTRSCGILTRFPNQTKQTVQRSNLGLLRLYDVESTKECHFRVNISAISDVIALEPGRQSRQMRICSKHRTSRKLTPATASITKP